MDLLSFAVIRIQWADKSMDIAELLDVRRRRPAVRAKEVDPVRLSIHLYRLVFDPDLTNMRAASYSCFENVTAILFLVAVSGYDQCLVEDRDSNQMQYVVLSANP